MYNRLRSSLAPKCEYFQPVTETKENPESNLLLIHLPGFERDQVGAKYDSSNSRIKVFGEGSLGVDNKYSRFKLAYPLPENCDVSRLQRKFEEETFTIVMPKKVVSQVPPKEEPKPTQQETAATPPKPAADLSKPTQKASVTPAKPAVDQPKPEKAPEPIPPKSTKVEKPKPAVEAQKDHESASREAETTTDKQKQQILTIAMPKSISQAAAPQGEAKTSQEKAPSTSKEAGTETKTEKAQVETPPKSARERRVKKRVSSADLNAPGSSKEAVAEPRSEKDQVETPPKSAPPSVEEPRDKRNVSFTDQETQKDQEDTTTAQKPLPDIEKPADDNQLRSLTTPEPVKVTEPHVLQGEILQKPTETTTDPKLQTGGVAQKGEEFEPKPTLPMATTKQTDENTQKGPGEFLPKTRLTTAPLDPKKQIEGKLQTALKDIMKKHENVVGRRAEDPEEKVVKEKIARPFEPRMPEKGMENSLVKATERKESRELGMAVKPSPKTPEKEKEASVEPATIYKEHTQSIIDTIGRAIKEVADSTSYAVTNIADHKLKDEEKNLLSMVMAALAAHVSSRSTSSRKPQN